jgi:selenocysteine-specific translation elongation factor
MFLNSLRLILLVINLAEPIFLSLTVLFMALNMRLRPGSQLAPRYVTDGILQSVRPYVWKGRASVYIDFVGRFRPSGRRTARSVDANPICLGMVTVHPMANLCVAVIAPEGYAKDLGKKGTASDITLYDAKRGEDTVTLIEPTKYPERLASLFYACSMADVALVVVDELNATFGECVLMLHCAGVKRGFFILRNYLTPDRIAPFVKGTLLENYGFAKEEFNELRENLLDLAHNRGQAALEARRDAGAVPIDHHFNVKGVGTVVLGYVAYGTIKRHTNLKVLPSKKEALIRSIQKHDVDYEEATAGDRVGLALKNVDAEELDRGFVLTNDTDIKLESTVAVKADLVKYWPAPLKEDMVLHVGHWMQFLPARLSSVDNGSDWHHPSLTLSLEKELVHPPGANLVLSYLEGGKLRVVGTAKLP